MSKIFSPIIYYVWLVPTSYLPFGLLYFLSNIVYFLTYHIVGYRKQVVRENLYRAFPDKSDEELKKIEKEFYKHFADFLMESIKSISISEKEILKRCEIINPEIPAKYYDQGKSVLVLCGHYNNWEYYAVGLAQQMKHKTRAAYQPLNNSFFNKTIKRIRERYGIRMVAIKEIPRVFEEMKNDLSMTVMVNDQSPTNPSKAYWNHFLGIETGWMMGAEKLAKRYNYPVLFGCIRKKKRGFYEVSFYEITDEPNSLPDGAIMDKHTELLEMVVKENPQYWLWSHRRWKHSKP